MPPGYSHAKQAGTHLVPNQKSGWKISFPQQVRQQFLFLRRENWHKKERVNLSPSPTTAIQRRGEKTCLPSDHECTGLAPSICCRYFMPRRIPNIFPHRKTRHELQKRMQPVHIPTSHDRFLFAHYLEVWRANVILLLSTSFENPPTEFLLVFLLVAASRQSPSNLLSKALRPFLDKKMKIHSTSSAPFIFSQASSTCLGPSFYICYTECSWENWIFISVFRINPHFF